MKQCSYCGANYPDDATECAIDRTPLDSPTEPKPAWSSKFPKFGIFSERKIPVSLALVSYLFFYVGAGVISFTGFMAFVTVFAVGSYQDKNIFLISFVGSVFGILAIVCMLMFPATMIFGYILFAGFVIGGGVEKGAGADIFPELIAGVFAVMCVYISRGLRMCSRRSRTGALILMLLYFLITAYDGFRHLLFPSQHEQPWKSNDWINYVLTFIVLLWQYHVLTRWDVRGLFQDNSLRL